MKKIRTLIVDDEPLARAGLESLLGSDPEIEVIGMCADGKSAVEKIRSLHPELMFLDVQMPQRDGFEVLSAVPEAERPVVIFATAYDQHAIRAFEYSAMDYLLKPFSDSRFKTALSRAKDEVRKSHTAGLSHQVALLLERVRELEPSTPTLATATPFPGGERPADYNDRIVLKADGALHFIKTSDVIWIEAQGDFVKVQTAGKVQLVRETLQAMEQKLDKAKFLRIHRSFLVNLVHVRKVEMALYGDYSVTMSDGTKLRLSRNYRAKLKALVKQVPVT